MHCEHKRSIRLRFHRQWRSEDPPSGGCGHQWRDRQLQRALSQRGSMVGFRSAREAMFRHDPRPRMLPRTASLTPAPHSLPMTASCRQCRRQRTQMRACLESICQEALPLRRPMVLYCWSLCRKRRLALMPGQRHPWAQGRRHLRRAQQIFKEKIAGRMQYCWNWRVAPPSGRPNYPMRVHSSSMRSALVDRQAERGGSLATYLGFSVWEMQRVKDLQVLRAAGGEALQMREQCQLCL